ncbi:hypothetical protein RY27_02835 [Litorilinea aerophila]|nr:hypothetical protein RY27_02835 [Litorilinea aerophila]
MTEVEAVGDRVLVLMNGQVRADARISELATTHNAILVLNQEVAGVRDALARLDGVVAVERDSQNGYPFYRVRGREDADLLCPAIYRLAADQGWPVRELRNDVQTLESVFNQLAVAA